ncbi:C2 domain-containing protein 5 (138 kDa C2 domain-containing phosphoprotein) [Durusdinium trenchii]|uniref:C2 domain-containing protein 5 (138 kDa C2 domain-containing phosphoprotein) n=1 Tax=Durusdinium trenchii TaxID=1381693 RepID=A0ABP0QN86_9DINO
MAGDVLATVRRDGLRDDGKYVEVSFNDHIRMSPKSTGSPENPVWGDSVMSIELTDDFQLQDYPLRLGVCSNETGPPDCGFVMINLEQILHSRPEMDPDEAVSMKGWFPLFDTMTGVRGRILVSIKMQFVGDQSYNDRFASSVGVRFFSIATPPQPGVFMVEQLLGLVEELRVVQDPEYNWRDLIRSDRSSNEERLRVFHNAAMRARRELGKQVQRLGANAVLGYREYVDLEGDATDRICIRAFGTAARITPSMAPTPMGLVHQSSYEVSRQGSRSPVRRAEGEFGLPMLSLLPANSGGAQSEALLSAVSMTRSSDEISVGGSAEGEVLQRGVLHSLDRLPVAERFAVCGVVAARAVKVFGSRTTQDNRESWWSDLREELLSHARCLGGDSIVGYREHVSITDEVITLSVMGTALRHLGSGASNLPDCSLAHASESRDDAGRLSKCAMCGEGMVPNILLATMDFPEGLPIVGRSELVEARVVRLKRKMAGEAHAQDLSEALPYLELELHKQLVHKMRVMGLNAAFGLRVEISHGSQRGTERLRWEAFTRRRHCDGGLGPSTSKTSGGQGTALQSTRRKGEANGTRSCGEDSDLPSSATAELPRLPRSPAGSSLNGSFEPTVRLWNGPLQPSAGDAARQLQAHVQAGQRPTFLLLPDGLPRSLSLTSEGMEKVAPEDHVRLGDRSTGHSEPHGATRRHWHRD